MLNFSVVLIARNEEKVLPRLKASLTEFRDRGGEVVLVDTGSCDNTASLAQSYGWHVECVGDKFRRTISKDVAENINTAFLRGTDAPIIKEGDTLFDYAAARNFAASLASNDMIAMPDCDEAYTKLDIDAIVKKIEEGIEQFEYNFVFAHDAEGKEVIKFMHSKFYNRNKMRWVGIVHEVLQGEAQRCFLDEQYIKLEHWQNQETNRSGYLKGLALDCFLDANNDRNLHYFARELMYTGRFESALEQFMRHIEMDRWPTERSQSMIHMGECNEILGHHQQALTNYLMAFDLEPNRREPLMKLAEYYWKRDKPEQAAAYASAALQIKGGNFYANNLQYYEHKPHEILYWAHYRMGNYHASKMHFDIARSYHPFEPKFLHDLRFYKDMPFVSFIIPTLGRSEGLARCIESIKNLNYPQEKIEILTQEDEPRLGVPKRVNELAAKAKGEWVVYASNDIEFHPDSLISALVTAWDNSKLFMAFNTGEVSPDEGNVCEHFMLHRMTIDQLKGEVFDPEFNHVGVDNLLWAKMKRLNQAMRCKRAIVTHHHFSTGKSEFDETYALGWNDESVKRDRELLDKKLKELV